MTTCLTPHYNSPTHKSWEHQASIRTYYSYLSTWILWWTSSLRTVLGKWRVETSGEVSGVINSAPSTALCHSRRTEEKTERTVKLLWQEGSSSTLAPPVMSHLKSFWVIPVPLRCSSRRMTHTQQVPSKDRQHKLTLCCVVLPVPGTDVSNESSQKPGNLGWESLRSTVTNPKTAVEHFRNGGIWSYLTVACALRALSTSPSPPCFLITEYINI